MFHLTKERFGLCSFPFPRLFKRPTPADTHPARRTNPTPKQTQSGQQAVYRCHPSLCTGLPPPFAQSTCPPGPAGGCCLCSGGGPRPYGPMLPLMRFSLKWASRSRSSRSRISCSRIWPSLRICSSRLRAACCCCADSWRMRSAMPRSRGKDWEKREGSSERRWP